MVDSTPPGPGPESYKPFMGGPGYGPPHPTVQTSQPISSYPGGPSFPSVLPQPTSSIYQSPQSGYPPPDPGYPQPQSAYPTHPGYPDQASPFTPDYSTYHPQHQNTYPTYEDTPPVLGSGQRPFFGMEESIGESPDSPLVQRYSSPFPPPNDPRSLRSSSPFPVPSTSPPHPGVNTYSPSGEYEGEFQVRREQEERDVALGRHWGWS